MTNEEALEQIQKLIVYHTLDMDKPLNLAISALEKQVPKKPRGKVEIRTLFGKECYYTCPTCGNALLEKRMNERQDTRYCWDCGQKIDWSEGETE